MLRRAFIKTLAAVGLAPFMPAPPVVEWRANTAGIDRATYVFWRNQNPTGPIGKDAEAAMLKAMRHIYDSCRKGD